MTDVIPSVLAEFLVVRLARHDEGKASAFDVERKLTTLGIS